MLYHHHCYKQKGQLSLGKTDHSAHVILLPVEERKQLPTGDYSFIQAMLMLLLNITINASSGTSSFPSTERKQIKSADEIIFSVSHSEHSSYATVPSTACFQSAEYF